jgi:hypothetical protein
MVKIPFNLFFCFPGNFEEINLAVLLASGGYFPHQNKRGQSYQKDKIAQTVGFIAFCFHAVHSAAVGYKRPFQYLYCIRKMRKSQ